MAKLLPKTRALGQSTEAREPQEKGVPRFDSDERHVAFESAELNLVERDTNGVIDIFVLDRQTGQIRRISNDGGSHAHNVGTPEPF